MSHIQQLSITKTSLTDSSVLVIERSSKDNEQLDVFNNGQLVAYVVVEDDSLNVCELEIKLTNIDIKAIKELSEDYLTQEIIDTENEKAFAERYAVDYSEDQKVA
jgi:hypothetical protein